MRKALGLLAMGVLLGSAQLSAGEFDRFVQSFAQESGAKRVQIPFLGFASFLISVGKPGGASGFKLAVFERGQINGPRFSEVADAMAEGDRWKPMIRVRSKDGGVTKVYEQQHGNKTELLIATLDRENATFVHVQLNPKALSRFIEEQSRRR